jgi:acyl-CoA thioester hydrolase
VAKRTRLREATVELEVPFHDCDPLGIVWHGHYYRYFDAARTQLLRSCGLDAGKLIGGTYLFMVSESRCRHAFPLSYGERFRVHAWFGGIQHGLDVRFELINLEHDRRSARGRTLLVCVDETRRLLIKTPAPIVDRILEVDRGTGTLLNV